MTENLQIELLKQQINSLVSQTTLPVGVLNLIFQDMAREMSEIYSQQLSKEYQEYQKKQEQLNDKVGDEE